MDTISEFIEAYDYPFYLGIDPGATGGLGLVSSCGQGLAIDIPTEERSRGSGTKARFDTKRVAVLQKIVTLFDEIDSKLHADSLHVCLEQAQVQVHGKGNNAYTGYRVAQHYAMWPLFLVSRGYDLIEVHPMTWKSHMKLLKQEKEPIRLKAVKLFPEADIKLKKDHNKAEALLLAVYRQRIEHEH